MPEDVLGVRPIARAVERATDSVFSGLEATLGRVCLPAAEELGLMFKDKVSEWRRKNMVATLQKAQRLLETAASEKRHAPPRLVIESLSSASWSDDQEVQEMWAGLLSSSCSFDGQDESNWIFVNILRQLTALQARVVAHACSASPKKVEPTGLIACNARLSATASELMKMTGCSDVQRIDRELDNLRVLGLIQIGFNSSAVNGEPVADLTPTALALHLFVRASGSTMNPIDYFGLANVNPTSDGDEPKPATIG